MTEPTQQTAFRLPMTLIDRIDRYAEHLRAAQPGLAVTRADAVRMLLLRALADAERAAPPRRKARP